MPYSMETPELVHKLTGQRVLPIIAGVPNVESAVKLAETFCEGGLGIMELPLRGDLALVLKQIQAIRRRVPKMSVGAGSVLNNDHLSAARDHGADFIVTPGTPWPLRDAISRSGLAAIPGFATPTEAMELLDSFHVLKWFPANGEEGLRRLMAIIEPLRSARRQFLPTGGIDESLVENYLSIPGVICCGGSWVAPSKLIQEENWSEILARAKRAVRS